LSRITDTREIGPWSWTIRRGVEVIQSAGLLLFRRKGNSVEVLLAHPGGPFWAKKDDQAWSIPKGEFLEDEAPLAAARREFAEETGFAPAGEPLALGNRKAGSKMLYVWAIEADWDPSGLVSNSFSMEWPPRSGRKQEFPEVDRAAWFDLATARQKIHRNQRPFLADLERVL
jgi:predicted NUDIX family NTP pyrophosphohydrolase